MYCTRAEEEKHSPEAILDFHCSVKRNELTPLPLSRTPLDHRAQGLRELVEER